MAVAMRLALLHLIALTAVTGGVERFLKEPQDAVVSQDQLHILDCTVLDRQGPIQWLRDGFGLGPASPEFEGYPRYKVLENAHLGEYHLMITQVHVEDDAYFECQVLATEHSRGLKSRRAKLSVQLPADEVHIKEGAHVEVTAGQPNTLSCVALNGKPAPNITWRADQACRAGLSDPFGHGAHNVTTVVALQTVSRREDVKSELSFVPMKDDQGCEFVCSAVNAAMATPKEATTVLEVLYRPEATMVFAPGPNVKELDSLTITCSAVGNPNVISWRWFENDKEMEGEVGPTLRLASVSSALHDAKMACEATNRVGSTRLSHNIEVMYSPRFVSEPDMPAVNLGDPVTLTCEVTSNPPASVVWRRVGSARVLGSQSSLRIDRVREDHFTTGFTCTASAGQYEEVQRHVRILKRGSPRISSPADQAARYGSTGIVECMIEGIPKPSDILWSKNDEGIDLATSKRYRVRDEDLKYGVRSVLEILSVQDEDFASYNCTAINELGADTLVIAFSIKELIPLAYIISGVAIGVLIIVGVSVALVVYRRKKNRSIRTESSSNSSDDSARKIGGQPNLKIEFSSEDTVDAWQQKNLLEPRDPPRYTSDYDQLRYPVVRDSLGRDYPEVEPEFYGGYGSHPLHQPFYRSHPQHQAFENPYGTLPRGVANQDPRAEDPYSSADVYGTYNTRRPRYAYVQPTNFFPPPPPLTYQDGPAPSPTDSKLSTNV